MTWQESDLMEAWERVALLVPPPYELTGFTFHGSEDPPKWVAFVYSDESASFGPEGIGSNQSRHWTTWHANSEIQGHEADR